MQLICVTASIEPERTRQWWASWKALSRSGKVKHLIVWNGAEVGSDQRPVPSEWDFIMQTAKVLPPVPAFNVGIAAAAALWPNSIIACLHDDLEIRKEGWDDIVLRHFETHPSCALACFSGCDGVGSEDIYKTPYRKDQLARQGFYSNMKEAESHGRRETSSCISAAGDGFSQIGIADFMVRSYNHLQKLGIQHHLFDSLLGVMANRGFWSDNSECWYIPITCHHAGGETSTKGKYVKVFDDAALHDQAHKIGYEAMRGILPLRVR